MIQPCVLINLLREYLAACDAELCTATCLAVVEETRSQCAALLEGAHGPIFDELASSCIRGTSV